GGGVHGVCGDRDTRRDQPRAAARGRGAAAPATYDDARRAVSLRTLGRPGALSADERQLRPARTAGPAGERQAEEEGATRRAGARGHGSLRGAPCRPGASLSAVPEVAAFVEFLAKKRNRSPHTPPADGASLRSFTRNLQ